MDIATEPFWTVPSAWSTPEPTIAKTTWKRIIICFPAPPLNDATRDEASCGTIKNVTRDIGTNTGHRFVDALFILTAAEYVNGHVPFNQWQIKSHCNPGWIWPDWSYCGSKRSVHLYWEPQIVAKIICGCGQNTRYVHFLGRNSEWLYARVVWFFNKWCFNAHEFYGVGGNHEMFHKNNIKEAAFFRQPL